MRRRAMALLAAFLVAAASVQADDTDPPGRAARLSDAQGSVSLEPAGLQEWTAATLNRPLTTGDRLWSDAGARAELDMGAAVARLGGMTGFSFLNLDDSSAQMQLTAGTLIVRVRDLRAGDNYEIDTPNLAVTLQQPGEYRVEVSEAGDATVVKVSEGLAQASGAGQLVQIGAQQRTTFTGSGELAADSGILGAPDELDGWSAARERQLEDSPSRQYVAEDVAGTQDLDDNGQWQETPQYGYVWAPTGVVAGWAPYRFGQWVWVAPWGWTWVDDARWGYAPFHYGRWVSLNSAWCWVPGPRIARPLYAPALVGWVGGPAGGPLTVSGNNVGWFPLGPREAYVPGYRVSPAYVRNVNITNTTIVNHTYVTNVYTNAPANQHYVNNTSAAVTAVAQEVFTSGQRLAGHVQHLPPALLTGAVAGPVAPAIVPSRASVLGAGGAHGSARPPAAVMNRPVLARTPLPRAPVPFDRQVSAIEANGGRPLARTELARLQPAAAAVAVRMVAPATASRPAPGARATAPAAAAPSASAAPAARYDRPAAPLTAPRPVPPDPAHAYPEPAPSAAARQPASAAVSAPYVQPPQPQPAHSRGPPPGMSAPPAREATPAREPVPAAPPPRPPVVVHPPTVPPSAPKPAPQPQAREPG